MTLAAYERRKAKAGGQQSWGGVLTYSGQLGRNLHPDHGPDFAEVSSAEPYAAMMQFGGARSAFPHLWGSIPARPFLGISDEDNSGIQDIISEALISAFSLP